MEKLCYLSLPPANMQILRIGKLEPDLCFMDKESKYISLNKPIGIEVLAAYSDKQKPTVGPSKELVKWILHWHIQKEKEYVTPKNVRFGKWKLVRENPTPTFPIVTPSTIPKTAISDTDITITKKSVERKKYPWIVNVWKESIGAMTITKQILDLRVSFIVSKLLVSILVIKKQLTKAIFEDEAVQFWVSTLGLAAAFEAQIFYFWYSMGLPKAKVCLEDGSKVMALLDTGAEINVMIRELMKEANLAIRKGPKLELVSHTSHSRLFLGLCEDVKVAIRGLKTRYPIFVVEVKDYKLVLGQPFLNFVKFSQKYKLDEIFGTITHSYTYQIALFHILAL